LSLLLFLMFFSYIHAALTPNFALFLSLPFSITITTCFRFHSPSFFQIEGKIMSEFSLSSTTPMKTHFSRLLLSDLFLFCSFVLSNPLYFSYFVFFSPYLLKLLSFLSPLFITTSLLLLALLTAFSPTLMHDRSHSELSEYKVSFILGTYQ